jgi:hypothetical protein
MERTALPGRSASGRTHVLDFTVCCTRTSLSRYAPSGKKKEQATGWVYLRKKLSAGALSQQLPLRLIEAVMPYSVSLALTAWLAY